MKQTLLVAGQELLVNIRRPGFIIMTLLIPALGCSGLLVASLFGGQVGDFFESQFAPNVKAIGYVDHSGLLTADLPAVQGRSSSPIPTRQPPAPPCWRTRSTATLSCPPDYLETGKVMVYGIGGGFSTFAAADSGDIRSFLGRPAPGGQGGADDPERDPSPRWTSRPMTLDEAGRGQHREPLQLAGRLCRCPTSFPSCSSSPSLPRRAFCCRA